MTCNFLARYLYGIKIKKGIKNFHLNIRSLKNKVNEVKHIVKDEMPDIFGLSEVELKREDVTENSLKLPGYTILFPKSWETYGYARVVMYVKNSFHHEHVKTLEDDSFQSIWIKGNRKNCKPIYFCHAYREHLQDHPVNHQRNQLEML